MPIHHRVVAIVASTVLTSSIHAGGFLNVVDIAGTPTAVRWNGTITVRTDQGPLGGLTNAQADDLVVAALAKWQTAAIPESAVSIVLGSKLPVDNNGSSLPSSAPQLNNPSDGINPIIYDTDGSLTDFALGAGASNSVIGFAGIQTFFIATGFAAAGQSVINGRFIDGLPSPNDITFTQMEGVIAHEIGHFLNLDHAQFNDAARQPINPSYAGNFAGYPTMYPLVHGNVDTLELDDKAWVSRLYPSAAFNSKVRITGLSRDFAGNLINGINIVARRADNPIAEAVSCVTGFLDSSPATLNNSANEAFFEIPGLEPNTPYFLDFEEIKPNFSGGSRVGPINPVNIDNLGQPEFINEASFESNSDNPTRSTSFVTPASGVLSAIDLRLNGVPSATNINEIDNGATFPTHAQAIALVPGHTVISGNGSPAENGNVDFLASGDSDIEDWYALTPPAGVEIYEINLLPSAGLDANLYTISFNQPGGNVFAPAVSLAPGLGVPQSITATLDSTRFGAGTASGIVYIGVDASSGSGAYTLQIRSRVATNDALVVSGVSGGTLDAGSGNFTITGQGFKNTGGTPSVVVSNTGLNIGTVTFVNSTTLNVAVGRNIGYINPSDTDITVTNQAAGGSYSGKRLTVPTIPVQLSDFSAE